MFPIPHNLGCILYCMATYGNKNVAPLLFPIIMVSSSSMHKLCLKSTKGTPLALAIGVFDGLHLGHSDVIKELLKHENNAVFTFNPHPRPNTRLVIPFSERLRLLRDMGVKAVYAVDTKDHIIGQSAIDFINSILIRKIMPDHIIVGEDFKLGKDRDTDALTFKKLCKEKGIDVTIIKDLKIDGVKLSSTMIRDLIVKADFASVEKMLGRKYSIKGIVTKGKGFGAKLGFKTANIIPHSDMALPSSGVYSTLTELSGTDHKSVCFVGSGPKVIVETHIPGIDVDMYGKKIQVTFTRKIREVKRFNTPEELSKAIANDIKDSV